MILRVPASGRTRANSSSRISLSFTGSGSNNEPESTSASRSRSLTILTIRTVSDSSARNDSLRSASLRLRLSKSRLPRITVSGVLNSWDASATNSCWDLNALSKRSIISSNVAARWPISSIGPRYPTRWLRSGLVSILFAVCVIRRTGNSAFRTTPPPNIVVNESATSTLTTIPHRIWLRVESI